MRDPARIERMLRRLRFQWSKVPDMRLGQLLVNATQRPETGLGSLFYIEDEALLDAVDAFFERSSNNDRQGDGG